MKSVQPLLRFIAALPTISFVCAYVFVSGVSGWGAYGAATLYFIPIGLSMFLTLSSIAFTIYNYTAKKSIRLSLQFAVAAAIPLGILLLREVYCDLTVCL